MNDTNNRQRSGHVIYEKLGNCHVERFLLEVSLMAEHMIDTHKEAVIKYQSK